MASGANHSRLTSVTYASDYVVNYNYGSGLDSTISRLTSLSDSSNILENYTYLGLGTVVKRAHPQTGVDLSYINLSGESTGDAWGKYTGLRKVCANSDLGQIATNICAELIPAHPTEFLSVNGSPKTGGIQFGPPFSIDNLRYRNPDDQNKHLLPIRRILSSGDQLGNEIPSPRSSKIGLGLPNQLTRMTTSLIP